MTIPPAGQTQAPPTSRGKRKLDFSSKPLRGKVFFLDLQEKSLVGIEHEVTKRGGVVEKFFHRSVRYLITYRHRDKRKSPAHSPLTLSPDTPEGGISGRGVSGVASPLSCSPVEGSKPKVVPVACRTRGAKMLATSVSVRT